MLMPYMLRHIADPTEPAWHGYVYIVAVFVAAVLGAINYYHAGFYAWRLAAKVRTVLIILTYKKALKVQAVAGAKDSGKIVNMVSVDAQFVAVSCCFRLGLPSDASNAAILHCRVLSDSMAVFFQGLIAPVQLAVITGLLWKEVGAFALIPAGCFVLSLPIVGLLNRNYGATIQKAKQATDSRLKLVREFIAAIRIVKYYAWEKAFERNIGSFREREVNKLKSVATIRVEGVSVFASVSPISTGSRSVSVLRRVALF